MAHTNHLRAGGWIGCGNYATILAEEGDTQIVRIEQEADGYTHPDMIPHVSPHRPHYLYERRDATGCRSISRTTARRYMMRAKKPASH